MFDDIEKIKGVIINFSPKYISLKLKNEGYIKIHKNYIRYTVSDSLDSEVITIHILDIGDKWENVGYEELEYYRIVNNVSDKSKFIIEKLIYLYNTMPNFSVVEVQEFNNELSRF